MLISRWLSDCWMLAGGSYPPETRRKYYISGPQWAAAYQGQALFHAPTREPTSPAEVMRHFAGIGIGYWTTHDTDVIRTEDLMTNRQAEILAGLKKSLADNGLRCSMVTCETFFHPVWSASPAAESPRVRAYAAEHLKNVQCRLDFPALVIESRQFVGGCSIKPRPITSKSACTRSTAAHTARATLPASSRTSAFVPSLLCICAILRFAASAVFRWYS